MNQQLVEMASPEQAEKWMILFDKYGGWAVTVIVIMLSCFLFIWMARKQRRWENWWNKERMQYIEQFSIRDKEITSIARSSTASLSRVANNIMLLQDEIIDFGKCIDRFASAITQGLIKIPKFTKKDIDTLTVFLQNDDDKEKGNEH